MPRARDQESAIQYYPRGFWQSFASPGVLWLVLLFVVPFYAVVAIALGGRDPIFFSPTPSWSPTQWQFSNFQQVFQLVGPHERYGAVFLRTFVYVFTAVPLCILIGFPVAWYLARARGRMRGTLLVLVLAPFWISYLMRMLAWQGMLEDHGLVNRILVDLHLLSEPYPWTEGKPITVILGLVYGYVPFFILPLFAALDRIDKAVLEAARDLGASSRATLWRVVMPLSKQGVLAGTVIIMLPMFGDYYTNDLLSQRPQTSMIGNIITFLLSGSSSGVLIGQGAALVLTLSAIVAVLMVYYLVSVSRASKELRR